MTGITHRQEPYVGEGETAPAPADQWQPISTAPKDGTCVLLFLRDEGFATLAYWRKDDPGDEFDWWLPAMDEWLCDGVVHEATHWMPLPKPPGAAPEPRWTTVTQPDGTVASVLPVALPPDELRRLTEPAQPMPEDGEPHPPADPRRKQ